MSGRRIKMHEFMLSFVIALSIVMVSMACCNCGSDSSAEPSEPSQAFDDCRAFTHTYATTVERCGVDSYANAAISFKNLFGGSCDNIAAVRDRDELHTQCIPTLATEPCPWVASDSYDLDTSCKNQLLTVGN